MKRFNEFKSEKNIVSFFGKLFGVRTQAHVLHLASRKYSEHKALGSFYEDIVDLTDSFIETHQGQYGLAKIENQSYSNKDSIDLLEEFSNDVKDAKSMINEEDTHLLNILDEISALTYQTIYKLKYLS